MVEASARDTRSDGTSSNILDFSNRFNPSTDGTISCHKWAVVQCGPVPIDGHYPDHYRALPETPGALARLPVSSAHTGHSALMTGTTPERRIYVESWQMECCGDPSSVDSVVHRTVVPADHDFLDAVVGAELSAKVTEAEEHHHDPATTAVQSLSGVVRSIQTVSCQYAKPDGGSALYPVTNSAVLQEVASSEEDTSGLEGRAFLGWLVSPAAAT